LATSLLSTKESSFQAVERLEQRVEQIQQTQLQMQQTQAQMQQTQTQMQLSMQRMFDRFETRTITSYVLELESLCVRSD
jgi:prefoldin subunit 5